MSSTPAGVYPINIRGVTCQKYGLKTGEGIHDYVKYSFLSKDEIIKEIQLLGVMSDFEPGKKHIEAYPGEQILFVIDLEEKYGEMMFFCFTKEAEEIYKTQFQKDEEETLLKQQQEDQENAAPDLSHLVFEDKPLITKVWESSTESETFKEIDDMNYIPIKPQIAISITLPKSSLNRPAKFSNISFSDIAHKVQSQRTLRGNFMMKKESEIAFQVAPICQDSSMQTMKNKVMNKAIQYTAQSFEEGTTTEDLGFIAGSATSHTSDTGNLSKKPLLLQVPQKHNATYTSTSIQEENDNDLSGYFVPSHDTKSALSSFLSKSSRLVESFLNRNKSIEIFHDTFQIKTNRIFSETDSAVSSSGNNENVQIENELKEIKNFADPMYTKSKVISCIDWMPKFSGYIAISAVKNLSFDQRLATAGLTQTSYALIWDFKQLVKPILVVQAPSEIFALKFNKVNPSLLVGGCITGQVVLWDLSNSLSFLKNKEGGRNVINNTTTAVAAGPKSNEDDFNEDEILNDLSQLNISGLSPKFISTLDRSHKKCVADIFWLPPYTQINHLGQIVSEEHLDGNSYQFLTIAADGVMMVWDIRYELIFQDELRHIARAKHIAQEKLSAKEGGLVRPLWSPIFTAHLKRLEGVGELGLCKLSFNPKCMKVSDTDDSADQTKHMKFMLGTEEGDILLADLCATHTVMGRKDASGKVVAKEAEDDDDNNVSSREYVKWCIDDHTRPPVGFQQSPFFPEIVLTVSDWKFNIWKVGEERPLFSSPLSPVYYTTGCWSPTRPAVLFAGCANGNIEVWDLSDTSTKASFYLKATQPQRLTSMEFLPVASSTSGNRATTQMQLLACGDDSGTLHVFEVPRSFSRALPKEDVLMDAFLKKESERRNMEIIELKNKKSASTEDKNNDVSTNKSANKMITASAGRNKLLEDLSNDATDSLMTKKEEEDFAALEAKFIADLNITLTKSE